MEPASPQPPQPSPATPLVSAVVCTRNRGDSAVGIIETILANRYPNFEVILVDQSTNDETAQAIDRFRADPRFQYIRSATQGAGRARNIGLYQAQGEIVLSTDDDCTVPPDWIATMVTVFQRHPRVAVAFCNVAPGPHDETAGFIPAYQRRGTKLVRTLWDKCQARGIGAGLALRREAILAIGGFDDNLGPGSLFRDCDEGDLAVRALLNHWWGYETDEVTILHYGFRTWEQGKVLASRSWYGIGAAYAKPLRCGYWSILLVIMYELFVEALLKPLINLSHFRRPHGLKQALYFCQGFVKGMQTPIDCQRLTYMPDPVPPSATTQYKLQQ